MITSLKITGYRGFESFEMTSLGRINLLVGTNNSGKTSILEAIHLLTRSGDPASLWQLLWRRGERVAGSVSRRQPEVELELDVTHMFTGHEIHVGSTFSVSAENESPRREITFSIEELSKPDQKELLDPEDDAVQSGLMLHMTGTPGPSQAKLPLTRNGGIPARALQPPPRRRRRESQDNRSLFIATESLDGDYLVELWDKIALTPDEDRVLTALRLLHPHIDRIAAQASVPLYWGTERGGFIVKLKDHDRPIPIGSLGDGMWRILSMAIAITQCKGGVFLIDEIDTGLHHSVMSDMWRLISNAARQLDVQVFATTHSLDCIRSLAGVVGDELFDEDRVTLQRIEVGRASSVPYAEDEIRVAADRGVEVR